MSDTAKTADAAEQRAKAILRNEVVTVRYQIPDVKRAIEFYTRQLGFTLEMTSGSAFGAVALGNLRLILSGPGSSGARPMPDGRKQEPGGWNRILVYVDDLEGQIQSLKAAGVVFRNTIETGPGGGQILIEDPDGNPIELHQAPK
jgi:glyoxylase I family protein